MDVRFSVEAARKAPASLNGYRYFVDLKNGSFVYVFSVDHLPPSDWPLVELDADEVEKMLLKED